MEEKKILLLQVIMELGKFFMTCDGQTDEREVQFINDYTEQLIQKDEATREQLEVIKNRMPEDLSIEYLVDQTKKCSTMRLKKNVERCLTNWPRLYRT